MVVSSFQRKYHILHDYRFGEFLSLIDSESKKIIDKYSLPKNYFDLVSSCSFPIIEGCFCEGKLIGALAITTINGPAINFLLYVHPLHRKSGIGNQLINNFITKFSKHYCGHKVICVSHCSDTAYAKLLKKFGFSLENSKNQLDYYSKYL